MNLRRLVLPVLLALSACDANSGRNGGDAPRDVTQPGSGDVEQLEESCEGYASYLSDCIGEGAARELSFDELCGDIPEDADPTCGQAHEEVFACMGSLSCDDTFSAGSPDHPCADVVLHAYDQCPEQIDACTSFQSWGGGDSCGIEVDGCFDGSAYGADCTQSPEGIVCTCTVDGATSTVTGSFSCDDEGAENAIYDACGFFSA